MRRKLIIFTGLILSLNIIAQDINYFFYNIPWALGTDTICKIIRNDSGKFRIIDPKKNEDQGYYCVAKPFELHYLKNKPDSILILGFPIGFCEKNNDTWITGESPALSVEIYYKSKKSRNKEFQNILALLKSKYAYIGQVNDKKNSENIYYKFKVNKNKDYPEIHLEKNFYGVDKIRIVLFQIPN